MIQNDVIIVIQSERLMFKKWGLALGTRKVTVFHTNFLGMIFCMKWPQLSKSTKKESKLRVNDPRGVVGSWPHM